MKMRGYERAAEILEEAARMCRRAEKSRSPEWFVRHSLRRMLAAAEEAIAPPIVIVWPPENEAGLGRQGEG